MSKLAKKLTDNFSEEQVESFKIIKDSVGWAIISNLIREIIKDLSLDDVDDSLSATEYKTECLSRKKTKENFRQLFGDIETITQYTKKEKINYE